MIDINTTDPHCLLVFNGNTRSDDRLVAMQLSDGQYTSWTDYYNGFTGSGLADIVGLTAQSGSIDLKGFLDQLQEDIKIIYTNNIPAAIDYLRDLGVETHYSYISSPELPSYGKISHKAIEVLLQFFNEIGETDMTEEDMQVARIIESL